MNYKTFVFLLALFCQSCFGLLLQRPALALPLAAQGPCAVGFSSRNGNLNYRRSSSWITCNKYRFTFQSDGNVVLYNSSGIALWATGTQNSKVDRFSIQSDGNVVLYEGNRAIWASNTSGNPGSFFVVQDDGNIVVYNPGGTAIFNTGTNGDKTSTLSASRIWLTRYFPSLLSWSNEKWDKESGDGFHFDDLPGTKGAKTGIAETSSELKQVSKDLSRVLSGKEKYMNTGYAYDVNRFYNAESISHAGIDYSAIDKENISVVVPGRVVNNTSYGNTGQFVTIEGADGNRWIYGHINSSRKAGDILKAGDSIGTIHSQGNNTHLHLEVQSPAFDSTIIGGIPYQTKGKRDFVLLKTISPLQAYWAWRNR